MDSPKLYVAFFRPRYGNYQHWGLYLESDPEHLVFEVTGEHPSFKRHIETRRPERMEGFFHLLYVAALGKNDVDIVKRVAAMVTVDNETVEWDCQEYVLDMLDTLEEEFVLDRDDEDYQRAREFLRERRGPN